MTKKEELNFNKNEDVNKLLVADLNRKLNVKSNGGEDFTGNLSEVNSDGITISGAQESPNPLAKVKLQF